MLLMFVAMLAWMSIIPASWSPMHSILGKLSKKPAVTEAPAAPASAAPAVSAADDAMEKEAAAQRIISAVKNYLLYDGHTLEEKVNAVHSTVIDRIQWAADPSVDPEYYSVAVRLPPNQDGYSLTYRFNYNIKTRTLTPSTSESNNLMNGPASQPLP
jgi:hypothetical protein